MSRLFSILAGAVIAAAFLGPGTVTTAASAGASQGLRLLWALLFATAACYVLQEAAARLTIASGESLGAALRRRYRGPAGLATLALVVGGVILGCAAYEAGNILGGVAGAALAIDLSPRALTMASGALALVLLGAGSTRVVTAVLGALVATMGVAFLVTAVSLAPAVGELARGLAVPSVPAGSGLLILGLVGTTVVPYNLFLGSGLARGQSLRETRLGLALAIGLGGLVSMAVVVAGTAVAGPFSFDALAGVLAERLGPWAVDFFGWGLFAAGFSSAVTAPLAAALTARGLFSAGDQADSDDGWGDRGWRFRAVWLGVLAAGVAFGLSGVRPVPVILAAQALNGLLLPMIAAFLFVAVNDRATMGGQVNGRGANAAMGLVLAVATLLGVRGVLRAAASVTGQAAFAEAGPIFITAAVALAALVFWIRGQLRSSRS
ncbi:MAG: Nramp family divalent metal transporter [Acidobacteriota bacterium]